MAKKIALLLGNGRYAISLHDKLRRARKIVDLTVALFPEGQTALIDSDYWVDILTPSKLLNILASNKITHVVFAGNFHLAELQVGWQKNPQTFLRAVVDPILLGAIFNLVKARSVSLLLKYFCEVLTVRHFEFVLASELLPELKPGAGTIAANGLFGLTPPNELEDHISGLVGPAIRELDNQSWRHVRQALIFDGQDLILREEGGTDALLIKAAEIPHRGLPRTLIKLCPTGFDFRLDPPVVAPRTFELAAAAHVDLVIIEAERGILFERESAIQICGQAGITLHGCTENQITAWLSSAAPVAGAH